LLSRNPSGSSPLQEAVKRAVKVTVHEVARELLLKPENQQRIREAFEQAFTAAINDGSLVRHWAEKIAASLGERQS